MWVFIIRQQLKPSGIRAPFRRRLVTRVYLPCQDFLARPLFRLFILFQPKLKAPNMREGLNGLLLSTSAGLPLCSYGWLFRHNYVKSSAGIFFPAVGQQVRSLHSPHFSRLPHDALFL